MDVQLVLQAMNPLTIEMTFNIYYKTNELLTLGSTRSGSVNRFRRRVLYSTRRVSLNHINTRKLSSFKEENLGHNIK